MFTSYIDNYWSDHDKIDSDNDGICMRYATGREVDELSELESLNDPDGDSMNRQRRSKSSLRLKWGMKVGVYFH